jgi:hypothetical protein
MTNIQCVECGNDIALSSAYDFYNGNVRCSTCSALLQVHIKDSMIQGTPVVVEKGKKTK